MTPTEEDAEILRNASASHEAGEITPEQERDVRLIVIMAQTEREILTWTHSNTYLTDTTKATS